MCSLTPQEAATLLGVTVRTLHRLLRFGSDLIFTLCEQFGTEVIIIDRSDDSTFEEDLASDVLEIITVFSARLYGSHSHKNKKIVEELKEVAKQL